MPLKGGPELTIVVPTLNERDNVSPLIDRLDRLLVGSTGKLSSSTTTLPTTPPNACATSAALIDAFAASADSAGAV
jgi:hypothetical protein